MILSPSYLDTNLSQLLDEVNSGKIQRFIGTYEKPISRKPCNINIFEIYGGI